MVRALLDGSKTQTRRIVKPKSGTVSFAQSIQKYCPYGQPGDRLWVRETWRHTASSLDEARAISEDIMSGSAVDWRADYVERLIKTGQFTREDAEVSSDFETWKPSIHMPRWASRILLEITNVRVERLQDISEADATAEGTPHSLNHPAGRTATENYLHLWECINGDDSWELNPWVWVIEFKRVMA